MTIDQLKRLIKLRKIVRVPGDVTRLYTYAPDGSMYPAVTSFDTEMLDLICALYDVVSAGDCAALEFVEDVQP